MRIVLRLFGAALAAGAVLLVSASTLSANQGLGPPQPASSSTASLYGFANIYSGSGPGAFGLVTDDPGSESGFTKGTESYKSDTTTSEVDFTLPEGVTVVSDPACANDDGLGDNYCLTVELAGCTHPTAISVNGSMVSFQIACDNGQSFSWFAQLSSLITTGGTYSTSIQFKVGPHRRTKNPDNMWQINPAGGEFRVGLVIF